MKVLIFSSLLLVVISASVLEDLGSKFQAFKLKHGKTYLNQAEEAKRFNIFKDNVRAIEEHNALYEQGKVSFRKGINKFADMTQEEIETMLTLRASKKPTLKTTSYVKTGLGIPAYVDWRRKGQVTGIKDQDACEAGWAFSIAGSTEAAYYRKSGKLVDLSAQQLVDCATDVNDGCKGGNLDDENLIYVKRLGLQSESSYPYKGKDGSCNYNASNVVTKITNYTSIQGHEDALLDAVANVGPVAVRIEATFLPLYDSGIYEGSCAFNELNHSVLIVGYGTENGKDFWIVKNSWGAWWGEQGYFRIAFGKNECGIAVDAVFPTVN